MKWRDLFAQTLAVMTALLPTASHADPCGMVPPIRFGSGPVPIARVGLQKTYVFYKDGIESIVLRPGFTGKVEEFGMLIPFPTPPAIRKVADDVFPHVAAAVDPPEVVVDLSVRYMVCDSVAPAGAAMRENGLRLKTESEEVAVLRREAVGMYEVAVLEAGSADALKRWMEEHGFRYPEGMDVTCAEYVADGWCFVAVKARVGNKDGADPRPGMRATNTALRPGSSFDGHVQAMGFRFFTNEFVVPMRLSAFNEGELRNVVYVLTDEPTRIANLPASMVVRQIPGWQLYRNVTDPLPLRVVGGSLSEIPDWRRSGLAQERDPLQHSGIARELFASDLLAVRLRALLHEHEQIEKDLLEIGEELGLRGPELDALHAEVLATERERMVTVALDELAGMTLTVIDGDFQRDVIASENLTFAAYRMPRGDNTKSEYDARHCGPAPAFGGTLFRGDGGDLDGGFLARVPSSVRFGALALALFGLFLVVRSPRTAGVLAPRRSTAALFALALLGLAGIPHAQQAEPAEPTARVFFCSAPPPRQPARDDGHATLAAIAPTTEPRARQAEAETCVLICAEPPRDLQEEADETRARVARLAALVRDGVSMTQRGRAVLELADVDGREADRALLTLGTEAERDGERLVHLWLLAAQVRRSENPRALAAFSEATASYAALVRPVATKWAGLLASDSAPSLSLVLDVLSRSQRLQAELLPLVLGRAPREFVTNLFTDENQAARRLAAGCLATLAAQGELDAATPVLTALRFAPKAERVPWTGGPLFLPGLAWTKPEARELLRNLIAWHVWCDDRGLTAEKRQIHNNLNSWALANLLSFSMPGGDGGDPAVWLEVWDAVEGPGAAARLLEAQGLGDQRRFRRFVSSTERQGSR